MTERVSIAIKDGIADVRLNRADKMNALDPEMFSGLIMAGRSLAEDPSVRVVVLSGEGRAFCAGLDFGSFQKMKDAGPREPTELLKRSESNPANRAQLPAWVWHTCPVPVIAAVHGVAFGGGLQIALGADIRIVSPDARLSVRETHWGLVPDMAGTQLLRDLMPLDVVKELTFTAREVSGTEAVELGLATRVADDPRAAAFEMAQQIAQRSPDAVRASKKLLNASRVLDPASVLKLESELQANLIGTPNQLESVKANFEKRAPVFSDPAA
jgi:enoyl-CoA hydratase/carnithine racemase